MTTNKIENRSPFEQVIPSPSGIFLTIQVENSNPLPPWEEIDSEATLQQLRARLVEELGIQDFTILHEGLPLGNPIIEPDSERSTLHKLGVSGTATLTIQINDEREKKVDKTFEQSGKKLSFPDFEGQASPVAITKQLWRGVNFEGHCQHCNEIVYVVKQVFDEPIDISKARFKCLCPNRGCYRSLDRDTMRNLIFYDCSYTINGYKKTTYDIAAKAFSKPGEAIGQAVAFDKTSVVDWDSLNVTVREPGTSSAPVKIDEPIRVRGDLNDTAKEPPNQLTLSQMISAVAFIGFCILFYKYRNK